ncbi:MAG TPA: ABC transporter ATP-binding protein [Mycobacteriales bacterium]|nr:ABC transporter ATP-binding protein [Mycobacteriales bacterium]
MAVELSLRGLRAGYGPVEVLHGVSLDVPAGVLTALLGPNGAGKTTLLSVVAGLLRARSGDIIWAGRSIRTLPPHERAAAGLLLIPERRGVFPDLTVRDNLEVFAGSRQGWDPALDQFPILRERLDQPAGSMSGGEQQMLAMSRALLHKPRLLLLDEISQGLAPRVTRQLLDVVAALAKTGTTVVLVEQHLSDALRMADVVYVLNRGAIEFAGEPSELTAQQKTAAG